MKENLTLYRGIAIPKEKAISVKKNIFEKGIVGKEGNWKIEKNDLRSKLDELFNKDDLTTKNDTRDKNDDFFPVTCACGSEFGASYYALKHNTHENIEEVSYIIKFKSNIINVYVDGKDFLYNAFQGFDSRKKDSHKLQKKWLSLIYGKAIEKYFNKVILSDRERQDYRIGMCDLTVQDKKVIQDHIKNEIIIGGRYGVIFKSAFFVKTPIKSNDILDIYEPSDFLFNPKITLNDFIDGGVPSIN